MTDDDIIRKGIEDVKNGKVLSTEELKDQLFDPQKKIYKKGLCIWCKKEKPTNLSQQCMYCSKECADKHKEEIDKRNNILQTMKNKVR